jgi:hypothetical protein
MRGSERQTGQPGSDLREQNEQQHPNQHDHPIGCRAFEYLPDRDVVVIDRRLDGKDDESERRCQQPSLDRQNADDGEGDRVIANF